MHLNYFDHGDFFFFQLSEPRLANSIAIWRPRPDEAPVMNTLFALLIWVCMGDRSCGAIVLYLNRSFAPARLSAPLIGPR